MNILVVDDEAFIVNDMLNILQELNYVNVKSANSGAEAILKITNDKIDLVFMDINLNNDKLNGIESVKKIKKIKKNILVIYTTGTFDEKITDEALLTTPNYYLNKPYSKNDIILALKIIKNNTYLPQEDSLKYFLNKKFAYDFISKKLFHNGVEIKIPKREIKLLELVLENSDKRFLTNAQIDDHIWENPTYAKDGNRRVLISRLNSKFNNLLFQNKKGIGYEILLS